jgi:CubicO group peptidase (beta-lactamase class C family)
MKKFIILLTIIPVLIVSSLEAQQKGEICYQAQIDSICKAVFKEWNIPGMAVVVIKDGKELYLGGYGKTSYDSLGTKVTPETQFVIASTTKAMTAVLLATLADKGEITWGDTVINHLPDFKLYDPWVTQNFLIKDIMVHKTGFRAYATDDLPHFGYDRDEIYTLLRHIQPTYSFRTTYAYNNAMYTVAAKIIEKYYGMSWDDAIAKCLFEPLEMHSSTTGKNAYHTSARLAKGHRHFKDGDSIRFELRRDTTNGYRWLSAVAPAGFAVTTVKDLGNWLLMHLGKGEFNGRKFLSKESHSYLFNPQTITGADSGSIYNYAQGWTVEQGPNGRMVRHTGLAYGYTALVAFFPSQNIGIAVLTNAGNTTNPHMAIAREVSELIAGTDTRDWRKHYMDTFMNSPARKDEVQQKDSTAPKRLDLYTGTYYKADFGEAKVTLENGELQFSIKKVNAALSHKNGDKFTMVVPGAGTIEVEFFPGTNVPFESLTFNIGDPIGRFYKNPF